LKFIVPSKAKQKYIMPIEKKKVEDFSKFEAIIELLFGDQIRKYDNLIEQMDVRIQELEKQLLDCNKNYDNKIRVLSGEIAGNIQNLDVTINKKIENSNKKNDEKINRLSNEKLNKKALAEKLGVLIEAITK